MRCSAINRLYGFEDVTSALQSGGPSAAGCCEQKHEQMRMTKQEH